MKTTLLAAAAITVAATVGLPAVAHAEAAPPCATGQLHVSNGGDYTELLATPPDTTESTTVPISMDTCELQVHPMGTSW
jgi:hypothetical protein